MPFQALYCLSLTVLIFSRIFLFGRSSFKLFAFGYGDVDTPPCDAPLSACTAEVPLQETKTADDLLSSVVDVDPVDIDATDDAFVGLSETCLCHSVDGDAVDVDVVDDVDGALNRSARSVV